MKKIVLTLAIMLIFILALSMTACGNEATTTTEPATTEAPLPEGYVLYDNGDISFAYPENFNKTDGSTVVLSNLINGNNITIVYEAKTDYYTKMTDAIYAKDLKPAFEAMGMTIEKYTVEQIQNEKGVSLTKVTQTATVQETALQQTLLSITAGDKTYTVTVTEMVKDADFVNNVVNSLGFAK